MNKNIYILFVLAFILVACGDSNEKAVNDEIEAIKLLIDKNDKSTQYFKSIKEKLDNISADAADNPHYWVQKARYKLSCGYYSNLCEKRGFWQRALKDIEYAKTLEPNNVEVLSLSGHIHRNLKKYKKAELDLQKALSVNSDHAWANLNYAILIREQIPQEVFNADEETIRRVKSLREKSKKAEKGVLKIISGDYRMREKLVAKQFCNGNHSYSSIESRIECEKGIIKNELYSNTKEHSWAYGNLAGSQIAAGKYKEGLKSGLTALEIKGYPLLRHHIATAYLHLWRESGFEDTKLLEKALKIKGNNVANEVIDVYFKTNDFEIITELAKTGYKQFNGRNSKEFTLLYLVIKKESVDKVRMLVEELGVNPQAKFKTQWNEQVLTPLHYLDNITSKNEDQKRINEIRTYLRSIKNS